jgi:hypothetical protein
MVLIDVLGSAKNLEEVGFDLIDYPRIFIEELRESW